MKAILEFNLPEDQGEFETATKAGKYLCALSDFKETVRGWKKYGDRKAIPVDEIHDTFLETVGDLDL